MTLEEQMICGALQTLNEEAMEDVLQSEPAEADPGEPPAPAPASALRTVCELPLRPRSPSPPSNIPPGAPEKQDHVVLHLHDDVFT